MRFSFRKSSAALVILSVGFICSCEEHHVGELPEAQKEQAPAERATAQNVDGSPAPSAVASRTPVEFFPKSNPR